MKIFSLIILFLFFPISSKAQLPPIGTIDFYGLRTVSEKQIRETIQIKEGDEMFTSRAEKQEIEKRLLDLPNVEEAQINPVCCNDSGKTMIYVGIREKGAPNIKFRAAPNGSSQLTNEIIETGKRFEDAHQEAILKGDFGEDDDAGHSLMKNPQARAVQEKFVQIANQNLNLLRQVLRVSSDAGHRALAAEIIAYYKDKKAIVPDLETAINDSNPQVRNNATRALGIIARYAQNHPEQNIKISYEPFVEMLNSLEWTDRNKASLVLEELTKPRDAALLKLLREKAFHSLIEMARWKNTGHAGMPFFILGRVAGFADEEIGQALLSGKREDFIQQIQKKVK